MRNFFKSRLKVKDEPSHREIAEILDTDEDRVINQYKRYLDYINRVKKDLVQQGRNIVGYRNNRVRLGHT